MNIASRPYLLSALLTVFVAAYGCSSNPLEPGPKQDTELLNAARTAQQAYRRGQFETAASQYRVALQRARVMDDADAIGTQAYNLALSLVAANQLDAAQALLDEAERELVRAGSPLADVLLTQARLAYVRSGQDAAVVVERHLSRVLTDPRSRPTASHRAQVALLQADLASDRSDTAAAAEHLATSQALLSTELPSNPLNAQIARIHGRIHLLNNEPQQAGQAFDKEARLMRINRRYRDMAKALRRSALAYQQAGLLDTAIDRHFRAARSWLAQRRPADAEEDIVAIEQLADHLADNQWRQRLDLLRTEYAMAADDLQP